MTYTPIRRHLAPEGKFIIDNGFKVLSRYGDWQGSPLTEDGYEQIYLCTYR